MILTAHRLRLKAAAVSAGITVVGTASATSEGSPVTCSLTGITGLALGDVVIAIVSYHNWPDFATAAVPPTPSGWTSIGTVSSSYNQLRVVYKVMTGTVDTSVSFTNSSANRGNVSAYALRGVNTTNVLDVAFGSNTSTLDPPAVTPVTTGALVFAIGIGTDMSLSALTTASTGYSNTVRTLGLIQSTAYGIQLSCTKQWSGSGSENPSVMSPSCFNNASATFAIRPA